MIGEVVRIVMDIWSDQIRRSLLKSKIEVFLFAKYVDDVDVATKVIKEGYRWEETGGGALELVFSEEAAMEDREK